MKMIRNAIAAAALAIGAAASAQTAPAPTAPALGMESPFRRGVNVLGYDPFWADASKARFQWRHFAEIRSAGFDFVRLNLQAFRFMDANNRLDPKWLAKLDTVVSEATKAGLGIIIDEHDFEACSTDLALCRTKLSAFWQQVAPRYATAPRSVAFELLNEPHDKLTGEPWNQLMATELAIVRETNPTRIVVVGPTHWNQIADLPLLKLPANDRNLLVTIHYYEPFRFTHQGATWVPADIQKLHGITFGTPADIASINTDFDKARAWSVANQRPILLGEFGAFDKSGTPVEYRALYDSTVSRSAEAHGFGWAYWQFDSDFILWDMKANGWNQPILKALMPEWQPTPAGERG